MKYKSLFIIGNGFDCYGHGLETKYSDFRKYIIDKYPSYNYDFDGILESRMMPDGSEEYDMDELVGSIVSLIDNTEGEEWGDLEAASGVKYAESILEKNDWFFNDVDWDNDDKEIRHCIYNNEDISTNIAGGFVKLRELFENWAFEKLANIDFSNKRKIKRPAFRKGIFLNFNYTSTLEELYNVPKTSVYHIHGFAKDKDSEIVFGHGDDDSVHISDVYFGAQEAFSSLVRSLHKDTTRVILLNQDFFKQLSNVKKIYSYGFSFSDVDMCYIDEISRRVNPSRIRWYFNSYDWKRNRDKVKKIRAYGYKIRKCTRW